MGSNCLFIKRPCSGHISVYLGEQFFLLSILFQFCLRFAYFSGQVLVFLLLDSTCMPLVDLMTHLLWIQLNDMILVPTSGPMWQK